ncbi:hypothetical protein JXA70_15600 [candidate division KSB1 bacterium]|nr:hypothetical protein [candidate division KSB1 bacterium]
MDMTSSRIDLHVHTHHSRTAGNWILDQIQINECYTAPMEVYKIAKSRGMDYVTLTDHDVISGALEIAHMPDFFISEEISAFFPQDHAKVHIIAFDINETQHKEIQQLRFNIYELVPYLNEQQIVHALAHPYFKMGPALTMQHIEQMLLMFEIFEVKNGGKQMLPDNLFEHILNHLTPEKIWQLADKYDMIPVGDFPWQKHAIAGSDDHGGIMISSPHTLVKKAATVAELLSNIKAGHCQAAGHGGTPLAVAHGAMAVGFKYLKTKRKSFDLLNNKLAWLLLDNVFEETRHHSMLVLGSAFVGVQFKNLFALRRSKKSSRALKRQIMRELKKSQQVQLFLKGRMPFDHENNLRFFESANTIVNQHLIALFGSVMRRKGGLFDALKHFAMLKNIAPLVVPYFVGFKTENADRPLMRESAERLLPHQLRWPRKIAIFSDNNRERVLERDEINYLLEDEFATGYKPIYFIAGESQEQINDFYSYEPLVLLNDSPRYGLPPILKVAYDFSEEGCESVFIDTLGPMGILGMFLGKLLKIRVLSTYHESEVRALTEQSGGNNSRYFKSLISLFYAQIDQVRLLDVPSAFGHEILEKSKTAVRILGETIELGEPEFTVFPETDIY